jgi:hypothetical protein
MKLLVVMTTVTTMACAGAPSARNPPRAVVVEVELGLDLRALPVSPSEDMIDRYVLGQGDRLRERAPAGVDVEIRHIPGAGVLYARFRGSDPRSACALTIADYLADAPRLPIIDEPAVHVTTPCHEV